MPATGFPVALAFEDGVTRFIATRPDETVADASYRMGINIPLDCRDGACGTCRCLVEAGSFLPGDYIEDALTEEDAAEGYALACQMKPTSELVLRIAASSDACKTKPAAHTGTVTAVQRLSDTTVAFDLLADGAVEFLPGQYVNIEVPGSGQKRSYSFASPSGTAAARFLVRHIPGGVMSSFLEGPAAAGTRLAFAGPVGSFYLRPVVRPVLMLAGGTGLAPFLSMLARLAATGTDHPIHMIYGVTADADLVATAELDAFAARLPAFTWTGCVADPASAHARKGYVTAHMDHAHLHKGDVDVYLCGPPAMVDAVRAHFTETGTTPRSFHFEKFNPSGVVQATA